MRNKVFGLCIAMMGLVMVNAYGQDKPMKWGKVNMEDLQMSDYAADTNATAVILGEFGELEVLQTGEVEYNYHVRVKLLSEAAYDAWGTYSLFYNTGKYGSRIRNVEGNTFVIGSNGKSVRHKLGKKSIFKEKLDGQYEQLRFTLPALEPGAVVEFRYKMISDSPVNLPDWDFQHSEPTRWSELRTDFSDYYNYVRVSNIFKYTIQESTPNVGMRSTSHRWALNDVPALREEPFVTTVEDYRLKIEFQLASYYTNVGMTNFMRSWEELAEELRSISEFGRAFKPTKDIKKLSEEITQGKTSNKDKMIAIYNYVHDNHIWDGGYDYVPERNMKDVLKTSRASNAEQVVMMVSMLRAAGVEANPVLISTRQHGKVKKEYPLFTQFNYLIAHVKAGGEDFLLDATEEKSPYNMLPKRALNGFGWMVAKDKNEWIPVSTKAKYTQLNSLVGTLSADGSFSFDLTSSNSGYRAFELRNELDELDERQFVQEKIIDKTGGFDLQDITITNVDSLMKPLNVEAKVNIDNFGMVAGDFIYVSPHAVNTWEENPLRLPERTFPVDFGFARDYIYTLRLQLPEGYALHEQPNDVNYRLPLKGGAFRRQFQTEGSVLVVQSRLTLANSRYSPKVYQNLREMYDKVIAAQADQIVLKKITDAGH